MSEEIGSRSREPFYKLARESCTTLKALELTLRPSHERLINAICHRCWHATRAQCPWYVETTALAGASLA